MSALEDFSGTFHLFQHLSGFFDAVHVRFNYGQLRTVIHTNVVLECGIEQRVQGIRSLEDTQMVFVCNGLN